MRPVISLKVEVIKERGEIIDLLRLKSGRTAEGTDLSLGQGQESPVRGRGQESPVMRSRSGKPGKEVEVRKAR